MKKIISFLMVIVVSCSCCMLSFAADADSENNNLAKAYIEPRRAELVELLLSAKLGSTSAFEELFARYKKLLRKYSVVNGIFDEDLYQEQCVLFAHCIEIFDMNR